MRSVASAIGIFGFPARTDVKSLFCRLHVFQRKWAESASLVRTVTVWVRLGFPTGTDPLFSPRGENQWQRRTLQKRSRHASFFIHKTGTICVRTLSFGARLATEYKSSNISKYSTNSYCVLHCIHTIVFSVKKKKKQSEGRPLPLSRLTMII